MPHKSKTMKKMLGQNKKMNPRKTMNIAGSKKLAKKKPTKKKGY